jgi:hypothetical protein
MPTTTEPFRLPPDEAIRWFREKGYRIGFDWRDTWQEQHAAAFTVAKAMQLDVLGDIREAVDRAIAEGRTLREFERELKPTLQRKGWWGDKEEVDPQTGEKKTVQLGSSRRLKTIYDVNLRQAHSAGREERMQRVKSARPYARYIALPDARPEHAQWNDIVLPLDDPWWDTHTPLNGWGCRCKKQQLSERDLQRFNLSVSSAPPIEYRAWTNARTGQTLQVPQGIDPGFAYNPGKGRGGVPPQDLPVLQPTRTYADYGRPRASEVTHRPIGPSLLARVDKGPGKIERVKDRFREAFGTRANRPSTTVTDPTGVQVVFDERILPAHIARGSGRERYLLHAKYSVENPYEIWLVPYRRADGTVVMRQRYIGLFHVPGRREDVLIVTQHDGAFNVYPHDRIDTERVGYLHYTRRER